LSSAWKLSRIDAWNSRVQRTRRVSIEAHIAAIFAAVKLLPEPRPPYIQRYLTSPRSGAKIGTNASGIVMDTVLIHLECGRRDNLVSHSVPISIRMPPRNYLSK